MQILIKTIIISIISSLLISTTALSAPINKLLNFQLIKYECSINTLKKEKHSIKKIQAQKKKEKIGYKVTQKAYEYVGVLPYIWGAADLNYGCDCCGFTMCLYELYNINIGRTVEEQAVNGYSVSFAEAQPGDVIICPGHVGLYAGDNKVIHCPQSGEYVKVVDISTMLVQDIRRFED